MRTNSKVAALSFALLLGACGKPREQATALPDDLKRDLAEASGPANGLSIAPQSYQRMRFVSSIEQLPSAVRAKRPKVTHHHPTQMTASRQTAGPETAQGTADAMPSMATESPSPVSTPEAAPAAPTVVVAPRPAPEPSSSPAGSAPEGQAGGGGHGGGWGGLLGGIIGSVVIRGGHGGVDKCDPRTEGRPTIIDRPDFGLPLPTGQVFSGAGRRR
jgi:hypothetical protein